MHVTNDPLTNVGTRRTPQRQRAEATQLPNNAGGYVFAVDDLTRLRRFLTIGVEGGTYYVGERNLTIDNAAIVMELAERNPALLIGEIVNVSTSGRAPRTQPALFALAIAASLSDVDGRRLALDALSHVARTGTHLFQFVTYMEQFRGWGRAAKRAVGRWYTDRPVDRLAYQVIKYRQREGWTHRDVMRLSHPKPAESDVDRRLLFDWICGRDVANWDRGADDALRLLEGFTRIQRVTDARQAARIISDYPGLSWEMVPDAVINTTDVWDALLVNGVPQTALMRQLPRLTRLGMLSPMSTWTTHVAARLSDPARLIQARVHPINVLVAHRTYASGHAIKGSSTWVPSRPIVDALDDAFYAAFGAVTPTGKRTMLALDISGSMGAQIANMPLTCREASTALALVTANVEPNYDIVGFTTGSGRAATWATLHSDVSIRPLALSPRQRLTDAVESTSRLPFGGTDCALPMLYAATENMDIDTFVIYTDNETWHGNIHPHQALRDYRHRSGIAARLIIVGMTSTGFSIANPADAGSLDVVGFDSATPQLISDFSSGEM